MVQLDPRALTVDGFAVADAGVVTPPSGSIDAVVPTVVVGGQAGAVVGGQAAATGSGAFEPKGAPIFVASQADKPTRAVRANRVVARMVRSQFLKCEATLTTSSC